MKEEQYIQDLFRNIRELPPEVELSAIEQFVLAQPANAFQPPTGGGGSLLTIKNSIIMISSISIIGSAIIFFSGGGNIKSGLPNKSGHENIYREEVLPDSSAGFTENKLNEGSPALKEDVVTAEKTSYLPNKNQQELPNVVVENPLIPRQEEKADLAKLLVACDDQKHVTGRFVQALVKDGMIDPEHFSFKITHKDLVIDKKQQADLIFKEYKQLFEKLSDVPLTSGTGLSVSVEGKNCSASLSIDDKRSDKQNGISDNIQPTEKLNTLPTEAYNTRLGITSNNINTNISATQNKPENVIVRNLTPFSGIVLQSGGSVEVEAGDTYSISLLAGDEAAFEKVKAEVRNDMLYIEKEGKTKGKNWLVLKVTIPADKLVNLTIAGNGYIEVSSQFDGLNQLVVDGSGSILIDKRFDAGNNLRAAVTGSGTIQIANLKAKNVSVDIPGSGVVLMGGTADDVKTSITGSGSASLDKLHAQSATCSIGGSGIIEVNVSREINIAISGSGAVSYWGNPKVTQNITGSGIVEKKGG